MTGIVQTLSCLPGARAFLAGAAILAGALTSVAYGQVSGSGNGTTASATDGTRADEVALASLRLSSGGPVVFPRPLPPDDASILKRIFASQRLGNIPEAVRAQAGLQDKLLLGTVVADRYLGRQYRPSPQELSDWLDEYRDLPDAPSIRALLLPRLQKGMPIPPEAKPAMPFGTDETDAAPEEISRIRNGFARDPALDGTVIETVQRGDTARALRRVRSARFMPPAYAAQLRAEIAQAAFTQNQDDDALHIAQAVLKDTSGADQPALAFYIGGLAAWRLGSIDLARTLFAGGARSATASPHLRAASAFWASRASRAMHDATGTIQWLQAAAAQKFTLHGLLARKILRMQTGILPENEVLGQADVDAVAATESGRRAFALLQIDEPRKAEAEFRALWTRADSDPTFARSLLLVMSATGSVDTAARMAGLLQSSDGQQHDEFRFPMPRLRPANGFSIDPSLVYALTRLESNFDPDAISPMGARGLMQIMPATAQYITGALIYRPERLHEPGTNLDIGQRYIAHLAKLDHIDNDLIKLLASYNSGPGNFARWGPAIRDNGDPLLFIEAIPVAETRAFVAHALAYSWIYAARLRRPTPSLDALADGDFPRFTPLQHERKMAFLTPEPR